MNHKQKVVTWAAIAVVILMGLCPPFHYRFRGVAFDAGCHLIVAPPERGEIDMKRLFLQWMLVGLLAGALVWHLKGKASENSNV